MGMGRKIIYAGARRSLVSKDADGCFSIPILYWKFTIVRYIWYIQHLWSLLYSHLQINGCHYTNRFFFILRLVMTVGI